MQRIVRDKAQNGLATLVTSVFLSAGLLLATAKITQERSQSANALKQDLKIEFADSLEQSLQHYVDAYFNQRENVADLVQSENMLHANCAKIETLNAPNTAIMRLTQSSPFTSNNTVVEYQVEGIMSLPDVCGTQLQAFLTDVKAKPQKPRFVVKKGNTSVVEITGNIPKPILNEAPGYLKKIHKEKTRIDNLTNPLSQASVAILDKIGTGNERVEGRFLLKAAVDCDKTDPSKADTCVTRSRYLWLRQ